MTRKSIIFGATAILLAVAYFLMGSATPLGQDSLATLTSTNFVDFESAFDKSVEGPRLVLLLSPT
jgi:hypothetical protein